MAQWIRQDASSISGLRADDDNDLESDCNAKHRLEIAMGS